MVLDLPASRSVDVAAVAALDIISNNGKVAGIRLMAQQHLEQGRNDGLHARGKHNNGDIILPSPVVELGKIGVQLHVLLQNLDTFSETGLDALQHFAE